jgi:hypothetical protein
VRLLIVSLSVILTAALCSACDYPEAGYYALAGLDASGAELVRAPFAVEELVDDTEMTTGFQVLLPRPKGAKGPELVVVPLANGTDFSRRSWDLGLRAEDSGGCDLLLELMHKSDALSFSGACRLAEEGGIALLAGQIVKDEAGAASQLEFSTGVPALPGKEIARWELRAITLKDFERALGGSIKKAHRVTGKGAAKEFREAAAAAKDAPPAEAAAQEQPKEMTASEKIKANLKKKQTKQNDGPGSGENLPGRDGQRPR